MNRGAALIGALLVAAVSGGAAQAAPPPNSVAIDLAADYNARVVGERGIGLGQAVNAGDVNGDQIPDALVSAPGRRSVVYVIYGGRSWRRTIPVSGLPAERGYRLVTNANVETLLPVANAGDVNGDGIPDQLVGIPDQAGTVYVVYGQRPGGTIDLDQLQPSQGYQIVGASGDNAGSDVANAGDVNGDSIPDQLIGAPQAFMMPGRAYVVYGQRPGATIDLATLGEGQGYRMDGAPFDEAGDAVRAAGDVNVDGVPDALVGAESADHAYVVYGQRTATPVTVDLAVPGTWGYGMHGIPVTLTGASVDNAGDVNGDGVPDALIGGPACEADAPPTATVYVVYGQRMPPNQLIELANLSPPLGYRIADSRGECAGISVAGTPDLNGDQVPDQLIGAIGSRWADGDGAAYVVYGQRTKTPQVVDLVDLAPANGYPIGGLPHAATGWYVADAGDVDGDGTDNAWIWAPNISATPASSGASYLVGRPQPAATPITTSAARRRGRISVRLGCAALPDTSCVGTLTLRSVARTPGVLGRVRFSLDANQFTTVSVKLNRNAQRALRRVRRLLAVSVAVTIRQLPATAVVHSLRITLRRR